MLVHRVVTDPAPGLSALAELIEQPEDLEELVALRNITDDHARAAVAAIALVPVADLYRGAHAAVVMAPFLWFAPSRFSPGTFGVLYTARDLETAVRESAYHAIDQLRASRAPAGAIPRVGVTMDLRADAHTDAHRRAGIDPRIYDAADYGVAQRYGAKLREQGREGLLYDSVRNPGGVCAATFRPAAGQHVHDDALNIELDWDGKTIASYAVVTTYPLPNLP